MQRYKWQLSVPSKNVTWVKIQGNYSLSAYFTSLSFLIRRWLRTRWRVFFLLVFLKSSFVNKSFWGGAGFWAYFSLTAWYSFFVMNGKNDWINADMINKHSLLSRYMTVAGQWEESWCHCGYLLDPSKVPTYLCKLSIRNSRRLAATGIWLEPTYLSIDDGASCYLFCLSFWMDVEETPPSPRIHNPPHTRRVDDPSDVTWM